MALFVLSLCPFDISVGVGAFVIGLSQISSFLSSYGIYETRCVFYVPSPEARGYKKQKRSTEGCSKFKGPETKTSSGEIGLDTQLVS